MANLVTFGCSITYGQSLKDNHPNNKSPSKFAWPQVLGKLVDMPVVNKAQMGCSNKEISHFVLNYDFNKDDIVIIAWTNKDRYCIFKEDEIQKIRVWLDDSASVAFYEKLHDDYDMNLYYHNLVHYTNLYLDKHGIRNYHTNVFGYNDTPPKFFDTKLLNTNGKEYMYDSLALDNAHPGEDVHSRLANELFVETKGLTL